MENENTNENIGQSSPEEPKTQAETPEIISEETIIIEETVKIPAPETTEPATDENKQPSETVEMPKTEPLQSPIEIDSIAEPKKEEHINIKINLNKRKTIIAVAIVIVATLLGSIIYSMKGLVISAMVGWSPISRYSVARQLEKIYGKDVLNSLITKKLIDAEADKNGIIVSDDDINAEIADIETQLSAQGQTLDAVLKIEGMTIDELKEQITDRKQMEKLVADKIQVVDSEVDEYIKNYQITIPKGQEEDYKKQIKDQLEQQKMSDAINALIETLKSQNTIRYFVNY